MSHWMQTSTTRWLRGCVSSLNNKRQWSDVFVVAAADATVVRRGGVCAVAVVTVSVVYFCCLWLL